VVAPPRGVSIRTILCAVDFSTYSEAALAQAGELAAALKAQLIVAHIVEPVLYPAAYGLPPVAPVTFEQGARGSAQKALEPMLAQLAARGVTARALVEAGTASARLCELAGDEAVDLIVLASHGHTGVKHMLLGSTAERVVRLAPCAVITVKSANPARA
jgi:nucleotide-binding universal stress UspA family protein